jgi:hypothetical protein
MKTYTIEKYKCLVNQDGLTNVIEAISWEVTEPTEIEGTVYDIKAKGTTLLPPANPNTFIATDALTKEQIVDWIETYSNVDAFLNRFIVAKQNSLNPPHITIEPNFE